MFPHDISKHTRGRNLFSAFGDVGNAVLNRDSSSDEITCQFQKQLKPSSIDYFCAKEPSMPVLPPNDVSSEQLTKFLGEINIRHLRNELCASLQRIAQFRGRINKSKLLTSNCKSLLDELKQVSDIASEDALESLSPNNQLLLMTSFAAVPDLSQTLSRLQDQIAACLKEAYRHSGGMLSTSHHPYKDNEHLVFVARGDHLQQLGVLPQSADGGSVKDCPLKVQLESTIYQTHARTLHSQTYCVTRHSDRCHMVQVRDNGVSLESNVVSSWTPDDNSRPSFSMMSPYIAGEAVVTTDDGAILLWSADARPVKVYQDDLRFPCRYAQFMCHFGCHARQLVATNRTGAALVDIREKCGATELFALPNYKLLHHRETIRTSAVVQSRPSYHMLATEYSWILVDDRMPNRSVLHLNHLLQSPPYFMQVLDSVSLQGDNILVLASHASHETLCYQFSTASQRPVSTCSPWRVCHIEDFTCFSNAKLPVNSGVSKNRLKVPLAGVTAVCHAQDNRFAVYQGTVNGDLFSQQYELGDVSWDRTCAAGVGSADVHLSEAAVTTCSEWLSEAHHLLQHVFTETDRVPCERHSVAATFEAMMNEVRPAVTCSLCTGVWVPSRVYKHDADSDLEMSETLGAQPMMEMAEDDIAGSVCYRCGNSAHFSRTMEVAATQGTVHPHDRPVRLPEVLAGDMSHLSVSDATSRLLVTLWQGDSDNLHELIVEREDELEAVRSSLKKATISDAELATAGDHEAVADEEVGEEPSSPHSSYTASIAASDRLSHAASPSRQSVVGESPTTQPAIDTPSRQSAIFAHTRLPATDTPSAVGSPARPSVTSMSSRLSAIGIPGRQLIIDTPRRQPTAGTPYRQATVDTPHRQATVDTPHRQATVDTPHRQATVDTPRRQATVGLSRTDTPIKNFAAVMPPHEEYFNRDDAFVHSSQREVTPRQEQAGSVSDNMERSLPQSMTKRQRRLSGASSVLSRALSMHSVLSESPGFMMSPRQQQQSQRLPRSRSTSPVIDYRATVFPWLQASSSNASLLGRSISDAPPRAVSSSHAVKRPAKRKSFVVGF